MKRNFGMSGRGQRVVAPATRDEQDLAFVRNGLREGGVQIEPDLSLVAELAIHGILGASGALVLGPTVRQHCDARGAWLSSEPVASDPVSAPLAAEGERVAAALHAAGYFGPFGIDAYTYRRRAGGQAGVAQDGGPPLLQVRSEINARYTMGFAVARSHFGEV